MRFEGSRCIHSRNCVLTLPTVFRPNVQGPWIDPDGADPEDVAALARRCPSGAIRVERLDGGTAESADLINSVTVTENGPYVVRGELEIGGVAQTRATLCRCGSSRNKPFCDGMHRAAFTATGQVTSQQTMPESAPRAGLRITPAPNGPLLLSGPVEVLTGSGQPVQRGTKFALCRCGQSANKPFCDGTHTRVGFTTTATDPATSGGTTP
ncbi:MAG: CDGSH iron-sulfur domain-containing protein [Myxococcota bacterium]